MLDFLVFSVHMYCLVGLIVIFIFLAILFGGVLTWHTLILISLLCAVIFIFFMKNKKEKEEYLHPLIPSIGIRSLVIFNLIMWYSYYQFTDQTWIGDIFSSTYSVLVYLGNALLKFLIR